MKPIQYPHDFYPVGKTLEQLAQQYGVSTRTISRWKIRWKAEHDAFGKQLAEKVELQVTPAAEKPKDDAVYKTMVSSEYVSIVQVKGSSINNVVIPNTDPKYDEALNAIDTNDDLSVFFVSEKISLIPISTGAIDIDEKGVKFRGYPVHGALADSVVKMYLDGRLTADHRMVLFMDKLLQNPDSRVFEQLWPFLNHNDIEVDKDGDIIAYKKVRDDYFDIYSGTIRNKVGDEPSMPRVLVTNDPNQTCSAGLHVCAKSYLAHFGDNCNTRTVLVKIHPKDVVSVPVDYNGAKMRVCKYTVIGESYE